MEEKQQSSKKLLELLYHTRGLIEASPDIMVIVNVRDYDLELMDHAGDIIPVSWNASVYRDRAGKIAGVYAIARDITDQKRLEEKKKEIDLNTLLSEIITMINPPVDIDIKVVNKLPTILCDKVWMEQIVETQGGEIWLDSKVGVGSTFFFTIPKESKEGGGISYEKT